ncbi:MAG: formylglycine-generating enzyme family protein [bacterium]
MVLLVIAISYGFSAHGCGGGSSTYPTAPPRPSEEPVVYERVKVPAGFFWMGSFPGADLDEVPARQVYLNEYEIGKKEVTVKIYAQFLNTSQGAGRWHPRMAIRAVQGIYVPVEGREDYPITWVTWDDARACAAWMGGRLPTEAEWEKAARGSSDRRIYPWGDYIWPGFANYNNSVGGLWKVGTARGKSPYECLDMAGNAWEWTADWYDPTYYTYAPDANPTGPVTGNFKAIRGGGFMDTERDIRCSERRGVRTESRFVDLGFRVVFDTR